MIRLWVILLLLFTGPVGRAAEPVPVAILSSLVDPAKIDKLSGERASNPRLRKIVYWVEVSRRSGGDPDTVILAAQKSAGADGTARADADRESIVRNRMILEKLGCLDEAGMVALRTGKAPIITKGPYSGEVAEVDHIIARSVAPELDDKIYDLEFMPLTLNRKKRAGIGVRQKQLAEKWNKAGLLSESGFRAVMAAK
jgi:hypothetical protein